jgi:peptide/nickel transport system substrate-binding protein
MKRFVLIPASLLCLVLQLPAAGTKEQEVYPRSETIIVDCLGGRSPNPDNFNTWVPGAGSEEMGNQQLIVRPLWMSDYVKGQVLNILASEAPGYNTDFTSMTVKLRKEIYWSDGVEFTADDVIFTINTLMSNPGMRWGPELNLYVDNVYKTDNYTVVFDLKTPNSRFHSYFLDRWGGVRFMAKHVWENVADPMTFECNPPVSLGVYVLEDYDPSGYWYRYRRRDDWQRTVTGQLYGMPEPKFVLYYYYGPPEKKVMAQARHQLDMCDLTPETLRAVFEKNEYSRRYRKEYPWVVNVDPCITGNQFNCDKFPFSLNDVRWALVLAMDIVDFTMTGFDGMATLGVLHVPPTPAYLEWYYKPMQSWLENFTLDIQIDGKPFEPYDNNASQRLAQACRERGYSVPTDPEAIEAIWGYGWWKYAPDVAAELLERNGFKKRSDGQWLLPDGKPWKFTIVTSSNPAQPQYRNAFAMARQWRKFGIDVEVEDTEEVATITLRGAFDVTSIWPAMEPWGCHPDLFRTFDVWYSKNYRPIGEMALQPAGGSCRWKDPRMDRIIETLKETRWGDIKRITEVGIEGLKIALEAMPGIPTVGYPGIVAWDMYYWRNYPGAENPYDQPYHHWPNFAFQLPFLQSTGRE